MVLLSLVQQLQQRPTSTNTGIEECNFLAEGIRPQVIAEIAAVQRVLQRTHRVPCRVGEHREGRGAQQDQSR